MPTISLRKVLYAGMGLIWEGKMTDAHFTLLMDARVRLLIITDDMSQAWVSSIYCFIIYSVEEVSRCDAHAWWPHGCPSLLMANGADDFADSHERAYLNALSLLSPRFPFIMGRLPPEPKQDAEALLDIGKSNAAMPARGHSRLLLSS